MTNKVFGVLKTDSKLITAADGSQLMFSNIMGDADEIKERALYMRSNNKEPITSISFNEAMAEMERMSKLSSGGKVEEVTGFIGSFTDGSPMFMMFGVVGSGIAQYYQLGTWRDRIGREVFYHLGKGEELNRLLAELIEYSDF